MGFQLPTSTGYPDSPTAKNAMGQHHAMTFFRFGNPKNPSQMMVWRFTTEKSTKNHLKQIQVLVGRVRSLRYIHDPPDRILPRNAEHRSQELQPSFGLKRNCGKTFFSQKTGVGLTAPGFGAVLFSGKFRPCFFQTKKPMRGWDMQENEDQRPKELEMKDFRNKLSSKPMKNRQTKTNPKCRHVWSWRYNFQTIIFGIYVNFRSVTQTFVTFGKSYIDLFRGWKKHDGVIFWRLNLTQHRKLRSQKVMPNYTCC